MRRAVLAGREPGARRERILLEFERARLHAVRPWVRWALGMAAVVLLAVALGQVWRNAQQPAGPAKNLAAKELMNAAADAAVVSEIVSDNDFVEVPYAPPLAAGELVRVVRTELRPAALARMGVYIDTAVADEIPADVLLGEDGFPRGVRVVDGVDF